MMTESKIKERLAEIRAELQKRSGELLSKDQQGLVLLSEQMTLNRVLETEEQEEGSDG